MLSGTPGTRPVYVKVSFLQLFLKTPKLVTMSIVHFDKPWKEMLFPGHHSENLDKYLGLNVTCCAEDKLQNEKDLRMSCEGGKQKH